MTATTSTFGASIGKAIGASAGYALHGAATAASYTGRFGADIATGAVDGFVDTNTRLAALRAQAKASRAAFVPFVEPTPARSIKVSKSRATA